MTAPRRILTAAEMGVVDRETAALGISGLILMENAGHRVVEYLDCLYSPLSSHHIAIVCGRGNNGGDGLVIARQLWTRFRPRALDVVLTAAPEDLKGDAAENLRMLQACGCPFTREWTEEMRRASLVVDALLGTGLKGPATGIALDWIRRINISFPAARVVAVDLPSGLASDTGAIDGEYVRASASVTFTAHKVAHALPPACDAMGELIVAPIGSPPALYQDRDDIRLALVEAPFLSALFAPRKRDANKGTYGHVLAIAGSAGRTGAAAMCGMAGLRAGAGLVTVASEPAAIPVIAGYAPELMTEAMPDSLDDILRFAQKFTVEAIGPGLGSAPKTQEMVRRIFADLPRPLVADADALNALAGTDWRGGIHPRILTPHPGEMARLAQSEISKVQADRIGAARALAAARKVIVVLKGQRTLIAFPDGRVWVNPTGSPAMATGGTGDILTGITAGLLAQFPHEPERALAAAVYLHGVAGELGARALGEQSLTATDLLRFLPDAIHATAASVPDPL